MLLDSRRFRLYAILTRRRFAPLLLARRSAAYQILTESNDVETDGETDEFDASVVFLREGARSVLKAILKHEDVVGAGKPTMNLLKKFLVVDPAKRSTARELLESSPLSDVEPKEEYMDSW